MQSGQRGEIRLLRRHEIEVDTYSFGQGGGVPMKRMRVIPFILVWISASSFCSAASEVNRSWDELVRILVEGKKVTVTRMNSSEVEGKLTGITRDSITMQGKGAPQTVQRVDVYRVRYAGIRKKRALWGLAVGAVVGALAMAIPEKTQKDEAAVFGALLGMAGGAIAGGVLPVGPPLYEAEKVVHKKP